MSTPRMTEQEWAEHQRRVRISRSSTRVRSSTDARRTTRESGSSCEAAIQQTRSRRGESASSPYRSKWEAAYASKLELEKQAKVIKDYIYEMHTFKLAHRQYHRCDFLIWHLDGSIEIAQVKGYHKNLRAGIKGLKWAAQLNPWFTWTLKTWTGTGWDSHYVEV